MQPNGRGRNVTHRIERIQQYSATIYTLQEKETTVFNGYDGEKTQQQ